MNYPVVTELQHGEVVERVILFQKLSNLNKDIDHLAFGCNRLGEFRFADVQMNLCGAVKGEQKRSDAERTKTSRADLTVALKQSFDYCDGAFNSLTDADATQTIKMFGRDQTKLGALYFDIIHNTEMYGQIVTYYRAKNMVPPSTADRPARGGGNKK